MEFSDFVAARRSTLVRAAVLLGHPITDAEDLVQTTLTRAFRSWRSVQRAENPDGYVYRILMHAAHDHHRRRWNGEVPTEQLHEPTGVSRDPNLEVGFAVRRALATMSRDHREVLVLRYFMDLSERDTAAALGVAPGTVKSRASRALALLAANADVQDLR